MKKLLIIAIVFVAFSCKGKDEESFGKDDNTKKSEAVVSEGMQAETKTPVELGESIYLGKGTCVACHKVDEKLIGPSLQEIAKIYKEKNGSIVAFLKGESEAIVDPAQFAAMEPNLALTKTFSDEELQALEAYLNSTLK
jgi:cytochrome c